MPSPAQLHRMRVLAAQGTAHAAPGSAVGPQTSDAHRLIRAALDEDRRTLHMVQSNERKAEVKRGLLPKYDEYIAAVLSAGVGVQDEVLGYVMTWRMDIGDYAGAFAIARYILEHNVDLPSKFSRTPATLVAEEPAQAALRAFAAKQPFDVAVLREAFELTEGADMPDQVRAKLLFAMGRHMAETQPIEAIALLRRAVELNENVGAKKDIERLETRIKNAGGDSAAGKTEQPPTGGA
jgi:Phage small terminase subunit.